MKRTDAALFYKASLENPNISVEKMIEELYKARGKTPEEIEQIIKEYKAYIEDAKNHGQQNEEIYNYLMTKRDEIVEAELDDKGNIANVVKIEGDTLFDPSGKSDLTSLTGSPSFEFDDESTKKENVTKESTPLDSNIYPQNIPVFNDNETNELKIYKGTKEDDEINFPNAKVNTGESIDNPPINFTFGDDDENTPPTGPKPGKR